MDWTPEAVARATGGSVEPAGPGPAGPWTSVSIDSRTVGPGALFVPVVGGRPPHDWIAGAVAAGATGTLVAGGRRVPVAVTAVRVPDTAAALADLGRAARSRLGGPVVGITGSVGKTSTKDLLAAALGGTWRVAASEKSLNNELGVPLTLVNAAADTEVAVIEMGARGVGHIAWLAEVARPTVAVVTVVASAHIEAFGSLDGVAAAKGELVAALGPSGTAVLNADDHRVAAMAARHAGATVTFSATARPGADVAALDVGVDDDLRASFTVVSPWGRERVTLGVRGAHQVVNALAAATAAGVVGTPLGAAVEGLAGAVASPWRMDVRRTPAGAVVVNDAYNANPTSMDAALRSLAALPARRRVAVLGTMAELGPDAPAEHRAVAALAARLGIEVVAVGTDDYGDVVVVGDLDEARDRLGPLGPGDAVLVKASRVAGLERLAARLLEP